MPTKKPTTTTPKKRKVSPKGCRQKGTKAEVEIVKICEERNLPAQRVVGSGAFNKGGRGAASDVKIGVVLEEDGSYPSPDESRSILRAESKNRASNPEYLHVDLNNLHLFLGEASKEGTEQIWKDLAQDQVSKVLMLRRAKIPQGALKDKDYNQVFVAVMGIDDWIDLVKRAYPDRVVKEIPKDKK